MKYDKISMSQEMKDALGAVKQGEEELKRRKTKILPTLSVLLGKIGNHEIYR